jgi:hypothetical protein
MKGTLKGRSIFIPDVGEYVLLTSWIHLHSKAKLESSIA